MGAMGKVESEAELVTMTLPPTGYPYYKLKIYANLLAFFLPLSEEEK